MFFTYRCFFSVSSSSSSWGFPGTERCNNETWNLGSPLRLSGSPFQEVFKSGFWIFDKRNENVFRSIPEWIFEKWNENIFHFFQEVKVKLDISCTLHIMNTFPGTCGHQRFWLEWTRFTLHHSVNTFPGWCGPQSLWNKQHSFYIQETILKIESFPFALNFATKINCQACHFLLKVKIALCKNL